MLKRLKEKFFYITTPVLLFGSQTITVLAEDDVTRKLMNAKTFVIGALEIGAAINLAFAIFNAGRAKGQKVEQAEEYRTNSIIAFAGITMLNIFIGLWQSW